MTIQGAYVTAERVTKGLVIRLTEQGKAELLDYAGAISVTDEPAEAIRAGEVYLPERIEFSKPHAAIWSALLEDLAARDLYLVSEEENANLIGALTSSPLGDDTEGRLIAFLRRLEGTVGTRKKRHLAVSVDYL